MNDVDEEQARTALRLLWEEVLESNISSPDDNFFDSGGSSLLASVLLAEIRSRTGVYIPLWAFFQDPTLGGLVQILESNLWGFESR